MIYYELAEKYRTGIYFDYSPSNSIDGYEFYTGGEVKYAGHIAYDVDTIDSYIDDYDLLPVAGGPLLASRKFRTAFSALEDQNQVQYFPAVIRDKSKLENHDFFALNVVPVHSGLDKERSVVFADEFGISEVQKLALIPGFMGESEICRLGEDKVKIIVTSKFRSIWKQLDLKGAEFVPEGHSIY